MTKQQIKALEVGKALNPLIALEPSQKDVKTILDLVVLPMKQRDRNAYRNTLADIGLAIYNAAVSA